MSKSELLKKKFGSSIRESLGAGEGKGPTVVEHPTRNKRFEGISRASGFHKIALGQIIADAQHRENFNQDELKQLADSLEADGLIAPIVVRWDNTRSKYVIIAGERRYRAAKLCGWKEITCDVKPDEITTGEIAELQLAENHARKNLNPIELAKAFQDVIDKNGYTVRELSTRLGVNETTVSRYTRLLNLAEDLQRLVADGTVSAGVAREAARFKDSEKQRDLIQKPFKTE